MNKESKVHISEHDLPLYCPVKEIWDGHPKVFIPIEKNEGSKAQCPYCGTLYILSYTSSNNN